jgi:hypothetical protein
MLLNYFQKLDDIFSYLLGNYLNEKKFLQKKIKKDITFIDIGANVGTFSEFIKNNFDFCEKNAMDQSFELIASCIGTIFTEEEVWTTSDVTKKEMNDFLESMNSSQFKDIEKFFETMPKLSHTIKVVNPKTNVESEVVLEGLASFFG